MKLLLQYCKGDKKGLLWKLSFGETLFSPLREYQ